MLNKFSPFRYFSYQSNGYLLIITFILDRYHRSLAVKIPTKYEGDLKNLTNPLQAWNGEIDEGNFRDPTIELFPCFTVTSSRLCTKCLSI